MNKIESIEEIVAALQDIENSKTYEKLEELINNIKEVETYDLTYRDKYLNLVCEYEELEERNEELQEWTERQEEEIRELTEQGLEY